MREMLIVSVSLLESNMIRILSVFLVFIFLICIFYQKGLPHFVFCKAEKSLTWRYRADPQDKSIVKEMFKKPLKFLDYGSQCYVFLSEDEKYVVKICRASRYWSFLNSKGLKKKETDFLSYFLAFHFLPEESQVVFLHLNRTKNLKTKLEIVDPFGFSHFLEADDLAFYIQKKATPLSVYLKEISAEESKLLAKKLLNLFHSCSEKGLQIRDIYPKNIGVYEGNPFWIDPGRIKAKPCLRKKEFQESELYRFMTLLMPNLRCHSESFSSLLEEEFETFF